MAQSCDTWIPKVPHGDTWLVLMTYLDEDGQPVDLTGYTAELTLTDTDGAVQATLTTNSGGGLTVNAQGEIEVFYQLGTLAMGVYTLRLTVTDSGGVVSTLVITKFAVI